MYSFLVRPNPHFFNIYTKLCFEQVSGWKLILQKKRYWISKDHSGIRLQLRRQYMILIWVELAEYTRSNY